MLPKETFVNAFFANCILLNVYSVAVTQFAVQNFQAYLLNTTAVKIWIVQISNLTKVNWVFQKDFFLYVTLGMWFAAFVYFCLRPFERIQLSSKAGGLTQAIVEKGRAVINQ